MDKDNDNGGTGLTEMRVACLQLHEMYVELQHVGFSRREALSMVTKLLCSGVAGSGE